MSNKPNNSIEEAETFTMVYDSVRRAKMVNGIQFKAIDKLLYSYLLGWQASKDDPANKKVTKVNSSVRELQKELGVSKGTVETSLKTLEKMGLILIKSGGVGFPNEYDVIKFSEIKATNQEVKVDDFMKKRQEYRENQKLNKQVDPVPVVQETNKGELKDFDFNDDPFLNDCGMHVCHDAAFDDHLSTKPQKSIKSIVKPQDGRICEHCYFDNAERHWDCGDSKCHNNKIPF